MRHFGFQEPTHAGIATQLQVEKMLIENGTSREEIAGRILDATWEWKEKFGGRILNQMRGMGASADWDRERFTMDEGLSEAVLERLFVSIGWG